MPKTKKSPALNTRDLANRITSITQDLNAANADVALLQRLKDAEVNAKRLERELTDMQKDLSVALADEHDAKQQAAFANIRNMAITSSAPVEDLNPGLLKMTYKVTYETLSYDSSTRRNLWRANSAHSIRYLPDTALKYLIEAKPELIPQRIMDLAPGKPAEAIHQYIQAIRRGYLSS
ncbi:hypothetical protein [Sphingorhabdus sp. EL138]|uniref:hypothetical protein n=1 Tax=Sphingorhabdus sp. EL138 TaxID=2073156 RepID=UPI000D697546|nr:hypothetical protein [Sphingorhabdus sp. EL138]